MQHEHHRVPVTALSFWDQNVLLSGEGSLLKAYDTEQKNLLDAVEVLPDQAIHGIIVEDDSIFVWGGRLFCQLSACYKSTGSLDFSIGPVFEAEDWILDASFSPASSQDSRRVALLTAHNALFVASLSKSLQVSLEPQIPGSNCILYAAHVTWLSASKCLIASGTAFGDVIIWSCSIGKGNREASSTHETHYNFLAHEGSVFGVKISSTSVASALGGRMHVLASCSDDRTIRLWDISNLASMSSVPGETQRETGFGTQVAHDSAAPTCLGQTMGHGSRIWQTHFFPEKSIHPEAELPETVHVVSFGEDASCITHRLGPSHNHSSIYSMKQLEIQKCHSGKNIWSVATDQTSRIATGGADGSIALRSFADLQGHGQPEEIVRSVPGEKNQSSSFRTYSFISPSALILTTNSGELMMMSLHAQGGSSCKQVSYPIDTLVGFSTMAGLPSIAFSAGTRGCVHAYFHELGKVLKVTDSGSKVAGLFTQPPRENETAARFQQLLITNVGSQSATLCQIKPPVAGETDDRIEMANNTLSLPADFVVTSFAHATHVDHRLVVLGSRSGSIAVYIVPDPCESSINPQLLHRSVHGKEAVTCLRFVKDNDPRSTNISFLSTGRDGTYAGHRLELSTENLQMNTEHQLSLPFGPNIEGMGYSPAGQLWIWGFRSKHFVVWNINTQQEVMKVECGGANRNWAFQLGENGGTFVWTKASKVYYEAHTGQPFQAFNSGGHGREIKSLAISPTDPQIIATGAEDTDIKLSTYKNGTIRCLHTLQKHNTGIQHLKWSADGQYLFSSGGFEEFYVWKISYDVPCLDVWVLCESAHPNSGSSDLRVMHFDARSSGSGDDEAYLITMVYSDSSVRAWRYVSKSWSILAAGNYITSCLTQSLLSPNDETGLTTGSTDGHLGVWKIDTERECVEWTFRHQVHQSAILSLISHDLIDDARLFITGGDDNAIGVTRMEGSKGEPRTLLVPRAHAAAVTALAIVGQEGNGLRLVSASIDQRIKLWQIDVDVEKPGVDGIDVKLLQTSSTAVADVSSIQTIRFDSGESGVLVCGVGMDFWKM